MHLLARQLLCALAAFAAAQFLQASIPDSIPYQGRISVDGTSFAGTGRFKFAIYEHTTGGFAPALAVAQAPVGGVLTGVKISSGGSGYSAGVTVGFSGGGGSGATATATLTNGAITAITITSGGTGYSSAPTVVINDPDGPVLRWTNIAGTTTGPLAEPPNHTKLEVVAGSYTVGLGDPAFANMAALPGSLAPAAGKRTFVRVWFDDGKHGFQPLLPDAELRSVPFAREAISAANIGGIAASTIARLDAANTFTHVDGLTIRGTGPAAGAPAAGATLPASGPGTRLEFLPGYSALRAGSVSGNQWDAANIGLYSTALGQDTTAQGLNATALGFATSAGGPSATALGFSTVASGNTATAMGWSSQATAPAATAFGQSTTASGLASTSFGYNSTAGGPYSTAMGSFTSATGWAATAMGNETSAAGNFSTTIGEGTLSPSYGQLSAGTFNLKHTGSPDTWVPTDPLFVVGNGTNGGTRSDALVVLKSGDTVLNGSLQLADVDGLAVGGPGPGPNDSGPVAGANVPLTGAGTRLLFIPGYGAFRAGTVTGPQWDAANIGLRSFATGYNAIASGPLSTAFGSTTTASGAGATAFGWGSTASGYFSIASGITSTASGNLSIALGSSTRATGIAAVALGSSTHAAGDNAIALGLSTAATGTSATAIGTNLTAAAYAETCLGRFNTITPPASATEWDAADRLFTIGNGTADDARSDALVIRKNGDTTINGRLTVNQLDGFAIAGTGPSAQGPAPATTEPPSGAGTRMYFIPGYGSVRAGTALADEWDAAHTGLWSVAMGRGTTASGAHSVALGAGTVAEGSSAVALGSGSDARGMDSFAMGRSATATAFCSVAFGNNTSATGSYSFAAGHTTSATGESATAFGENTTASGYISTALGSRTIASGREATALGLGSEASGDCSTAIGVRTTARSGYETAIGCYNSFYTPYQATGWDSRDRLFVVGNGTSTLALSDALTIFKSGALLERGVAATITTPVVGALVPANGAGARMMFLPGLGIFRAGTVEGDQWDETNTGLHSVAFGYSTVASGTLSVALGGWTTASGHYSVALGDRTLARSFAETSIGRLNTDYTPYAPREWDSRDRLFVVGNGATSNSRSDALIVYKSGNATLQGALTQGSDRNRKTDIVPADTAAVLAKVATLPLATWKYKDETVTHLGPMAQDFFAAFQLGGTDKGIASVDADGVALAAIQELKKQLELVKAENAALKNEQAAQAARLAALEAKLK